MISLFVAIATFFACLVGVPLLFGVLRLLGVYTTVEERRCHVYVLFGKVVGTIDEPGLHFLWLKLGWKALLVGLLGRCQVVDLRLDQEYLRSQAVNSSLALSSPSLRTASRMARSRYSTSSARSGWAAMLGFSRSSACWTYGSTKTSCAVRGSSAAAM